MKKIFFECGNCRKLFWNCLKWLMIYLNSKWLRYVPLAHTGLDYFGPMLVKIERRQEKRWDAIFTCLNSRAIHMEIKRFRGRRVDVKVMYSDNGTNFQGAETELKKLFLSWMAINWRVSLLMKWKFNPLAEPHFGGVGERLIKTVKKSLYAEKCRKKKPCRRYWLKWIVNSRKLTYVSSDRRFGKYYSQSHFVGTAKYWMNNSPN
jgi:hypothetical protein